MQGSVLLFIWINNATALCAVIFCQGGRISSSFLRINEAEFSLFVFIDTRYALSLIDHIFLTMTILLHPLLLSKFMESILFLAEEAKLALSRQMTIAWLLEAMQAESRKLTQLQGIKH